MDQHPIAGNDLPVTSMPPPPTLANLPIVMAQVNNSRRPTAATVIAIVLLVFAGFILLAWVAVAIRMAYNVHHHIHLIASHRARWVGRIQEYFDFIAEIVLGIGLLRVISWARIGTIIWLICALLLDIVT